MPHENKFGQITFCWNVNYKCNYRCPYCFFYNRWAEVIKDDKNFSKELWLNSWKRIYDMYGSIRIETAGGEPFVFKSFTECINEICKLHTFRVTTNLSCSIETLTSIVEHNSPERLQWNTSFHPHFAKLEEFLKKVSFLKENKFEVLVMYVAYPFQLKQIPYLRKVFNEMNVEFFVQAFQGEYEGKSYPGAYGNDEESLIYNRSEDYISADNKGSGLKNLIENQLSEAVTKGKLCLAGHKYAFVDSNGIVYRCTRERKHPMGDFLNQDFRLLEHPLPCEFDKCPCEFTWLVGETQDYGIKTNEDKASPALISVAISDNPPSASSDTKGENTPSFKYPPPGRIFFCWDICFSCNYRCSYCYLSGNHQEHHSGKSPYLGIQAMAEVWNRIYKKYGKCHIHISGGEPTTYPDFFAIIAELSSMHALEFDTNLSFDPSILIEKVKAEKVKINSSFHADHADFNTFFSKVLRLRDKGFKIGVSYVGYPPFLPRLEEYREICNRHNVEWAVQAFRGTFQGKEYPSSYTDSERKLINALPEGSAGDGAVTKEILKHHTEERAKRERERRLCRMGQMLVKIYPNGNAFRCCASAEEGDKVGNIFEEADFKLLDEPRYCEKAICPCWRAMIVGKESQWQHYWYMM